MNPLEECAEITFFDMRGCGRSERVASPRDLHVSHLAEDIRQLMAYFGDERWTVLGFSFGGRVGLEVLSRHPELVARFVLASSSAYPAALGSPVIPQEIESLHNAADVRDWALSTVDRNIWRDSARQKAIEVIRRVEFSTQWLNAIRAGYSVAYRDRDYSDVLRKNRVPVLVLHGEFDQYFEVEQARRLVAEVPMAKLAVLGDAGHFAHMDTPEEWNAAIAEFLAA